VALYHNSEHLGLGHTFPIGEPWLPESLCTHMLVSLPYPFSPDFEICCVEGEHIHIYWLLPITEAEKKLAVENSQEELEQIFEEQGLEYWKPNRKSLV
jgi:Suppressor of fused protein (SUFU)